ncbi:hypothetical protein PUN28_015341 [Cardiocondyla obscurior]|uniref:RING-type domain-containing protein n=1 Tax=Cardiocondyla obscurior TaxID=286306 RepID=A0AAW2ETR8_9HYME
MKILCSICHDLLSSSDDIFFTRCGHVFHHRCLVQWLQRSQTCPQCRENVTEKLIHRAHFTISNADTTTDNADNSSFYGQIDNLKFQILLNEKNIKYYTSKNATLEKQNSGLRHEVRKVEREISQKNSTIHALRTQLRHLKEKNLEYKILQLKFSQKQKEIKHYLSIRNTLATGTREKVHKIVGNTMDHKALYNCILFMRKIILKKTRKIKNLQAKIMSHS